MPEETKEVKTFMVYYKCDECDDGYMTGTGVMLSSNPAQFPHECNGKNCSHKVTFTARQYPRKYYTEVKKDG